jgi:hypothetical protein
MKSVMRKLSWNECWFNLQAVAGKHRTGIRKLMTVRCSGTGATNTGARGNRSGPTANLPGVSAT